MVSVVRLICFACLFNGSSIPSIKLLLVTFVVAAAVAAAAVVVGFIVTVGSMRGGLYARYMGGNGAPSKP